MIGAAGHTSVGKLGETQETVRENSFPSIHRVSSDTAVYIPGLVAGQSVDLLVDTGSAVTLVNQWLLDKVPKNI